MKKYISRLITVSLVALFVFSMASFVVAEEAGDDNGAITTTDGIFVIESKDGSFRYQLDGRVYIDAAIMMDDEDIVDLQSGSEIRRMRFALKATLWKNWTAEIDVDFSGNEVGIKDAWLGYAGCENWLFKVGNFRSPFSLEEVTSSRYISFIERALPNTFPPGRLIGFGVSHWGNFWQVSGGVFGQEAGDIDETEGEDSDEGSSLVGRVTIAPLNNNGNTFHVGAAYAYRTTDAFTEKMRFRGYDETKISKIRFLSTGKVKDVENVGLLGLEAVLQLGSIHLQGEYITADVSRIADSGKSDYALSGGYAFVSFFITGDSMPYDVASGEFGRVVPKNGGAIEVLARYSWLDLNVRFLRKTSAVVLYR